jgi:hypothetical protein
MVIADFNGFGVLAGPGEANPELIIDTDGMLTETVSLECLKPIAGRNGKVFDRNGFIELDELPQGHSGDLGELSGFLRLIEQLGVFVIERENHEAREERAFRR